MMEELTLFHEIRKTDLPLGASSCKLLNSLEQLILENNSWLELQYHVRHIQLKRRVI